MNDRKATDSPLVEALARTTPVFYDAEGAPAFAVLPWPVFHALVRAAAGIKDDHIAQFEHRASITLDPDLMRVVKLVKKCRNTMVHKNDVSIQIMTNLLEEPIRDTEFRSFDLFFAGGANPNSTEDATDAAQAARIRARIDAGEEEVFPSELIEAMDTGENPIRVFRKHRGLTQVALAAEVGIDQSYLSELESGAKTPSAKTLRALARALGVDMEILLAEDD